MKKMNEQYNKLNDLMENISDIISDLEEKRDNIEDNANDKGRDMTEMEQKKYDKIDEKISSLYVCVEHIENAIGYLEDYIDY